MDSEKADVHTTLNKNLYHKIKILAVKNNCNANELIDKGMEYIISKYEGGRKNE